MFFFFCYLIVYKCFWFLTLVAVTNLNLMYVFFVCNLSMSNFICILIIDYKNFLVLKYFFYGKILISNYFCLVNWFKSMMVVHSWLFCYYDCIEGHYFLYSEKNLRFCQFYNIFEFIAIDLKFIMQFQII